MEFFYGKYENEIKDIENNLVEIFGQINDNRCKNLIQKYYDELKQINDKIKLEIAFVGQYSAGKSSIISALTGNKTIRIAQGVATTRTQEYEWGNVLLIDTPGISTENTEHDEIAYKYMDKADLLIYTVTVNGFDELIANDFHKIAFDQNKGSKMMVVVNKTSMESIQNKNNWIKHIKEVISPLSDRELKLTFIDAKDYIEGLDEENSEDAAELIELSNFEEFIHNLNSFIFEKGYQGRLLSPATLIQTHIDEIINVLTTDDQDVLKLQELLRQKKFIVSESRKRIEKLFDSEVNTLESDILSKSTMFISKIAVDLDQNEIEGDGKLLTMEIDTLCEKTSHILDEAIVKELNRLLGELDQLGNSVLMNNVMKRIEVNLDFNIKVKDSRINENAKKIPEIANSIGMFMDVSGDSLVKWVQNAEKAGEKGLKIFSGSDGHKTILEVGHFFGKKFKPYEAQKIAAKFGKIGEKAAKCGKFMSGAQVVLAPAMAILEEYQEKKYEDGIKSARSSARNNTFEWCESIKGAFNNKRDEIMKEMYDSELENIQLNVEKLRFDEENEKELIKKLREQYSKVQNIADEIAKNDKDDNSEEMVCLK